ncbi:alpha/beta hydrolase [Sulfurimonas sp. SAG-AH-194-I05]|nr:alpha/beta hydrolase [Sulfurimonas sp. SAG-AH-194-I05]MDF1875136.1 alpha/beta hydrolase [Sulfurimonas sp. SAG-AH-194-I05]
MAKKVLLLHGWGGSNFPHWQSWLASEIVKEYGKVSFLEFSNYELPNLTNWKEELTKELNDFKPDIVICHSLANTLWFHLVQEQSIQEVEKLYLVAPPSFRCQVKELQSFFPLALPAKTHAKETLLITSTNDAYMTVNEAKKLQDSLGVPMKVLKDAGHINGDSGYGTWPWILEKVSQDLKNS